MKWQRPPAGWGQSAHAMKGWNTQWRKGVQRKHYHPVNRRKENRTTNWRQIILLPYKNKEQRKTETHHQQKHKTALWEVKYVISERQLGESVKFRNKETYRINSKNNVEELIELEKPSLCILWWDVGFRHLLPKFHNRQISYHHLNPMTDLSI